MSQCPPHFMKSYKKAALSGCAVMGRGVGMGDTARLVSVLGKKK